jgi:Putative prokaryotic signal transducing protein
MDPELTRVFVASGEAQAQQVRAFLEAAGVPTIERGEALRNTHGFTMDGLGAVEILVAAEDAEEARMLLSSAEAGGFRVDEIDDGQSGRNSDPPEHDRR